MKFITYLPVANFLLIMGLGFFFYKKETQKTAFFYNQKVFDQFKGKIELEVKLDKLLSSRKKTLDSLQVLIEQGHLELKESYQHTVEESSQTHQMLSAQYTSDIWKHINEEVRNYGAERGYDFILGASGNGSLMYANDSRDVTAEVVEYLNSRY